MSEESHLMSSLWPLVPSGATGWLLELCGDGLTGFMPPAMPDAAWVLNALYEHEHGPVDVSYHEYQRARADGSTPRTVAGIDVDAVGVATGGALGRTRPASRRPGRARRADALLPLLPLGQERGQLAAGHAPADRGESGP
ncbi:hypothetical protein RB200_28825 [Streptomyces sp. PmtG]